MAVQIAPPLVQSFKDSNGNPLAGGQLYTYVAGTSTVQTTYADATGTIANTNPVILNSKGEAPVWLTVGQSYKFVLYDAFNTLVYTVDKVSPGVLTSNQVNIKDFGAVGDGVANDSAAFQAVYNLATAGLTVRCDVPVGTYLLNTTPTIGAGSVIFIRDPRAVFTGVGTLPFTTPPINKGIKFGTGIQTVGASQGGLIRVDTDMGRGDTQVAIFSKDYQGSVTFSTDTVLVGCYAVDGINNPRTWTHNSNIVKKTTASAIAPNYCCGFELSAQNQTTTTGNPNNTDCLMGFLASYIGTGNGVNTGSAGFTVGGNGSSATQGWNYGVWIDNLVTGGVGVSIRNTSGGTTAAAGIDMRSHVAAFSTGALLLGNNHAIKSNDPGAVLRNLMVLDGSNYLQIGEIGIAGGTVINTPSLFLPNITTTSTATTGTAALPANPVGFIVVAIGGASRKIPYYAV